jgi:hypothetical protein
LNNTYPQPQYWRMIQQTQKYKQKNSQITFCGSTSRFDTNRYIFSIFSGKPTMWLKKCKKNDKVATTCYQFVSPATSLLLPAFLCCHLFQTELNRKLIRTKSDPVYRITKSMIVVFLYVSLWDWNYLQHVTQSHGMVTVIC